LLKVADAVRYRPEVKKAVAPARSVVLLACPVHAEVSFDRVSLIANSIDGIEE
jgi:hypothetical protein